MKNIKYTKGEVIMLKLFLRNIKKGFATNSSSYHSTLIMSEEEHKKWVNGEIEEINGWSYEEYEETDYETDYDSYTTAGGERVIVISIYGDNY